MIKTLSNLLKQDKEKYKVPRKVQDVIPIRRMWSDGIFQVGSKFSKSYQFSDINYQVASLEDKKVMFLDYSELLNSLDSGATTKITINNRRLNRAILSNLFSCPCAVTAGMCTAGSITRCCWIRRPVPTALCRRNISPSRWGKRTSRTRELTLPVWAPI